MATKKTNTKKTTKAVKKADDGVDYIVDEGILLSCYDWGERQTCKITLHNAFVIYATIREKDGEYFLSYPSYKTKSGEYKNLAYCFDKDIIAEIVESVTDFMNSL